MMYVLLYFCFFSSLQIDAVRGRGDDRSHRLLLESVWCLEVALAVALPRMWQIRRGLLLRSESAFM